MTSYLGDVTVTSDFYAMRYQAKIEEGLNTRLEVKLKPGDLILTSFESLPGNKKKKNKVFERCVLRLTKRQQRKHQE